jgi:anti-anti-sigma regulatory factor
VLRLEDQAQDEAVIVVLTGRLDVTSHRRLRNHLIKVGSAGPRAVVVDLTGLVVESDASLAIFGVVQTRLEQWPGVQLLLVADSELGRTLRATNRAVRIHATVSDAVAAIGDQPPRQVARIRLPNALTSPRVARQFARLTCAAWGLGALVDDTLLLVGELVTNAVTHTASAPLLRLELRPDLFSVAVYDDLECEVSMRDPGTCDSVHGLLLVAQLATMWGCSPTLTGGKAVWATLQLP